MLRDRAIDASPSRAARDRTEGAAIAGRRGRIRLRRDRGPAPGGTLGSPWRQATRSRLDPEASGPAGNPSPGLVVALASLSFLLAGCGGGGRGKEEATIARGGVDLFDLLAGAKVEVYPDTNLPPEILRRLEPRSPMRSREIDSAEWTEETLAPERFQRSLSPGALARIWKVTPRLRLAEPPGPIRLSRNGAEIPSWDPATQPFPGEAILWSADERCIYAMAPEPPRGVQVEYVGEASSEFGGFERAHRDSARSTTSEPSGALPAAPELVRQIRLRDVSRRCLLLPAPGALSLPFECRADGFEAVVGVVPRAYRIVNERIEASPEGSDGVGFAIEVVEGSRVERLARRFLPSERVGAGFERLSVDLRPFRGRTIALRLVTDPGPEGDPSFDYGVFGELRFVGGPSRKPGRPHVFLIVADTLRPDRLGGYGYRLRTTPRLDAWAAANAVVYRDAIATSSWTAPSLASILTGLAVHQHGLRDRSTALPWQARTVAEILRDAGYATLGLAEGPWLGDVFGFDRGYDLYDRSGGLTKNPDWSSALDWIRERKGERPLFLLLHTYLVHAPYPPDDRFEDRERPYRGWLAEKSIDYPDVIEPYLRGEIELGPDEREHISRRYDALVARLDDIVGGFLERIEETLRDEPFLVVLVSDHGEEFFERGKMNHGHSLYQELLRVPLIVRFPGPEGRRRAGVSDLPVWTLDILPTVLDCAGVPVADRLPGLTLRGPVPDPRIRVADRGGPVAIRVGRYKLILEPSRAPASATAPEEAHSEELYDLQTDPEERRNLALERPEVVANLKKTLERFHSRWAPLEGGGWAPGMEIPDLERLRALGYLGGR